MTESRSLYSPSSAGEPELPDSSEYDENGVDQFGYTRASKLDMLERLAGRMALQADTMAALLAEYRRMESISEPVLQERLGLAREGYVRLRLCLIPRAEHFSDDVRKLAAVGGIEPGLLANLINEVQLLATLPTRSVKQAGAATSSSSNFSFGALRAMAARDRLEDSSTLREHHESYAQASAPPDSAVAETAEQAQRPEGSENPDIPAANDSSDTQSRPDAPSTGPSNAS